MTGTRADAGSRRLPTGRQARRRGPNHVAGRAGRGRRASTTRSCDATRGRRVTECGGGCRLRVPMRRAAERAQGLGLVGGQEEEEERAGARGRADAGEVDARWLDGGGGGGRRGRRAACERQVWAAERFMGRRQLQRASGAQREAARSTFNGSRRAPQRARLAGHTQRRRGEIGEALAADPAPRNAFSRSGPRNLWAELPERLRARLLPRS